MRSGHQFFGVGANAFSKAAVERVLRLVEHGALCSQVAIAFFARTIPNGSCVSFHDNLIFNWGHKLQTVAFAALFLFVFRKAYQCPWASTGLGVFVYNFFGHKVHGGHNEKEYKRNVDRHIPKGCCAEVYGKGQPVFADDLLLRRLADGFVQ